MAEPKSIAAPEANLPLAKQVLYERWKRGEFIKSSESEPIPRRSVHSPLHLSFAQQRLWLLDQLEPNNAAYNVARAIRLAGPLKVSALEQSLKQIVERHESLRTTFSHINGQAAQVISPDTSLALPLNDLSQLPEADRQAKAADLAMQEAQQPFDLERGPVFRASLLRLTETEHVLLLTMHHIACDGWSMGVLFKELGLLYEALSDDHTASRAVLPELTIQYADFSQWQREWLQGETFQSQLSYWKRQLEGSPNILEFSTDHPRPAAQSFNGARQHFKLSAPLTTSLKALSRSRGTTLFMTLLAGFNALLYRYTGQQDILVGTPIANRNKEELEHLIGFFANSLVVRTRISGSERFSELLGRVKTVALEAYANQDLPFEKLVEELKPDRDLSHNPLFQVMFALQNAPAVLELSKLKLTLLEIDNKTTKFDLTLSMEEVANCLTGLLQYNSDLFEAPTIARMIQHFENLLEAITLDPDGRIGDLRLLSEAESRQLECDWNHTARPFPANATLHELFAQQVALHPCAIALVTGASALSYAQLNARANQLAHLLRAKGIGPESVVGLCLKRSPQMVLAMLGVLKAGGAYLPLDPAYPAQRLAFMIADSEAKVVIGQAGVADKLAGVEAEVMDWEEVSLLLEQESAEETRSEAGGANLAYVIYTSGSTGMAKGVGVTHSNVVKLVEGADYVELSEETVMPHMAAVTFDAATFEVWGGLLKGGKVVVVEQQASLEEIADLIELHHINTVWLTAGLFHQMAERHLQALVKLENLLAGGDVLSVGVVEKFLRMGSGCRLINGYGPTENTTFTCCYEMRGERTFEASVPIGKPISNTEVYVLDHNLKLCPVGAPGQLFIGGAGLARGYFNRAELTAERFIPHPLARQAGERLYQSGDLVRYLADGNLEFLGRVDQQVKVRGFRIEPGEVEAALRECRGVQECVVMGVGQGGEKRLVGYVKVAGAEVSGVEVKRELSEKVPDYMVPSVIVVVEEMVLNASGKIDRGALPAPDPLGTADDGTFVAPRNPIEKIIGKLWSEVLDVEQISIHDNFFDLGGHSLFAAMLISRLRQLFQLELPLRKIFESPTLGSFTEVVVENLFGDEDKESRDLILIEMERLSEEEIINLLNGDGSQP